MASIANVYARASVSTTANQKDRENKISHLNALDFEKKEKIITKRVVLRFFMF